MARELLVTTARRRSLPCVLVTSHFTWGVSLGRRP